MVGGPGSVPDFLKDGGEPELVEEPMVGGPDSIPEFLKEPQMAEEQRMVGGPGSVPDFLKNGEEVMPVDPLPVDPEPVEPECVDKPWLNNHGHTCADIANDQWARGDWIDKNGVRADEACCMFGGGDRGEISEPDYVPVELDANSSVIGQYVIEGYEGNKNDWHYITIEAVNKELGEYKWTNKAGVEWSLKQSD